MLLKLPCLGLPKHDKRFIYHSLFYLLDVEIFIRILTFPSITEFFMNTTLSKTAQSAELLAASIIINELCKDAYVVENLEEHRLKIDMVATIVTSTFQPAEA